MDKPCLVCDVLMTIVNDHSHDTSSLKKSKLIQNSGGDLDHDKLEEVVDKIVERFSFLTEWGHHGDSRIHLEQSTGEIVDYLVEECNETAAWLKPELHHVPNETWQKHGVSP